MEQNPDFFAVVFERWCTGRSSISIKEEFNAGINHRIIVDIKGVLESASKQNLVRVEDKSELEGLHFS